MVALLTYCISPFETETVEVTLRPAFCIQPACFRVQTLSGLINIFFCDAISVQNSTKEDICENLGYHSDTGDYFHKIARSFGGLYCLNLHAFPTT